MRRCYIVHGELDSGCNILEKDLLQARLDLLKDMATPLPSASVSGAVAQKIFVRWWRRRKLKATLRAKKIGHAHAQ